MIILLISLLFITGCGTNGTVTDTDNERVSKSAVFSNETIVEDTIVLSPMNEGETVMTKFMVKNRSGRTLQIDRIHSGCGCTTAIWNNDPLEDGKDVVVTLYFNSNGQFGKQFKTIEICTYEGEICRIFLATEVRY